MNTFELEGWHKSQGHNKSEPIGLIRFRVSENAHLKLERLEETLLHEGKSEAYIPVENDIEIETPAEVDHVNQWKVRVFLSRNEDPRGMFHLVGEQSKDGSLVYSNSVMVDQLG